MELEDFDDDYKMPVHSLDKMRAAVESIAPDDARPTVVLVSTGAYCPVHK
jgi:hypothetical protein